MVGTNNDRIIGFDHGVITFMRDFIRLYVLIDVIDDTTEEPPTLTGDTIQLYFDRDEDREISDFDVGYSTMDETYNFRYVQLTSLIREPVSVSSLAHGFDCFFEDDSRNETECRKHTLWEVAFDLKEIEATLDSTVRLGIRVRSGDPEPFEDYIPNFFSIDDFEEIVSVYLPPAPYGLFDVPGGGVISFDEAGEDAAIEVTQAIQSRDNSLPLVEDKDTVARVYVEGTADGSRAVVYLHGTRDGNDLPGSPLAKSKNMFPGIDREQLHHTVNFNLPASWVKGTVEFQGRAVDDDQEITSSPATVQFTPKSVPLFWVVRLNAGTVFSPEVAPLEEVLAQQDFLETIFPVSRVDFPHVRSAVLPAFDNLEQNSLGHFKTPYEDYKQALTDLWLGAYLAAATSEEPNWDLVPDQIYGFAPACNNYPGYSDSYCGVSWPLEIETNGPIAVGYRKPCIYSSADSTLKTSCGYGVMAHETDHNLDRAATRSWGNHATDPATTDEFENPDWGCGARLPDTTWASLWNDDEIREVGFDPRPPLENGWKLLALDRWNKFTVVPSEVPDLMSYCRFQVGIDNAPHVDVNPDRWISGYRWLRIFCALPFPEGVDPPQVCSAIYIQLPTLLDRLRSGELEPEPSFYLSGVVGDKAGLPVGRLLPVFGLPGVPNDELSSGDYSIELQDASGETLLEQSFAVSFVDSEGGTRDLSEFDIQVPATEGTARVLLWNQSQLLDALEVSDNAPQVTVLKPVAGVHWAEGEQRIRWEANDPDGDALTFTILYTPDQGQSWHPVAWAVEAIDGEYYHDVDPVILPGGAAAQIRVIATDGFNTTLADSSVFSVEGKAPDGYIVRPAELTEFASGEPVLFEARGYDAEDRFLADEAFVWSYNSKVFGVGQRVNAYFPEGSYQITLQVTDSGGKTAEDSVAITIIEDADGDRVADATDNCPYLPNPAQGDEDADTVGDACDSCAGTLVPEEVPLVRLLVNRFALVDEDNIFDTVVPVTVIPEKQYTLSDTHGCSCTQIIEEFGLGVGHEKFGCSISAMDEAVFLLPSPP